MNKLEIAFHKRPTGEHCICFLINPELNTIKYISYIERKKGHKSYREFTNVYSDNIPYKRKTRYRINPTQKISNVATLSLVELLLRDQKKSIGPISIWKYQPKQ